MKKQKFDAELESGHKGAAVIVPFDPEKVWGIRPRDVVTRVYGKRPGHLVTGTINGFPFEGWIGHRWGRFFILVDEELQRTAGISAGQQVSLVIEPKTSG